MEFATQDPDETLRHIKIVEELRHRFADPEERRMNVLGTLQVFGLDALLGKEIVVTNYMMTFARIPNGDRETRILFPRGFLFSGKLIEYSELVDSDIPVNTTTAVVQQPRILDVDQTDADRMSCLELEVPFCTISTFALVPN